MRPAPVITKFLIPMVGLVAMLGLAARAGTAETSPGGEPFWHHAITGNQTGKAGMFLLDAGNGLELFVSATVGPYAWAENSFWYVLAHDEGSGEYRLRHVQPPYRDEDAAATPAMVDFFPARAGDAWQVVVALSDGTVIAYDAANRREAGRFKAGPSIAAATASDLDGDGIAELVLLSDDGLVCRDLAGKILWTVSAAKGADVVCGQLDNDAALEVVTSSGHVVDGGSKAVQWKFPKDGGWRQLAIGDVDGDGKEEWVAADAANDIHAMDVDLKKTKWVIPGDDAVDCIRVERLEDSEQPRLVVAAGRRDLRVYSVSGSSQPALVSSSFVSSSYHGIVSRFLVGDPDSDGDLEMVLGADHGGLGELLTVVRQVGLKKEWQSGGIGGNFLGPVIGDMTGDGVPEIVTGATESNYYLPGSGGVVVLDAMTQQSVARTLPIRSGAKFDAFRLGLFDVNGDGRMDVVMPSTAHPAGGVEIQTLRDDGKFELLRRFDPPALAYDYLSVAEVLDVDGDGDLEMVTGSAPTGSSFGKNVFLRVFDVTTGNLEWTAPPLPKVSSGVISMALGDVDGDGGMEAVVVVANTQVSVFDLKARVQESTITGQFRSVALSAGQPGFAAGTADGKVQWFLPSGGTYEESEVWNVASGSVEGITEGDGRSLWVVADNRVRLWRDASGPDWVGEEVSSGHLAPRVGLMNTESGLEVYTGLSFGIGATLAGGGAGVPVVKAEARGLPGENRSEEGVFTVSRDRAKGEDLVVKFELDGVARWNSDYTISGAEAAADGGLFVVIPAGADEVEVRVRGMADTLVEGAETLVFRLVPDRGYFCGPGGATMLKVFDDHPVVELAGISLLGAETAGPQDGGGLRFELRRSGVLSGKLRVAYEIAGTAMPGKDFAKLSGMVDFANGQEVSILSLQPIHDRVTEPTETLSVRLLPSAAYGIANDAPVVGTIADGEPTVTIAGVVAEPGGYRLRLEKSGGAAGITTARLLVIPPGRYSDRPAPNKTVKVGPDGGSIFIPSRRKETSVDVYLFSSDAYYLGANSSLSFILPGTGAR